MRYCVHHCIRFWSRGVPTLTIYSDYDMEQKKPIARRTNLQQHRKKRKTFAKVDLFTSVSERKWGRGNKPNKYRVAYLSARSQTLFNPKEVYTAKWMVWVVYIEYCIPWNILQFWLLFIGINIEFNLSRYTSMQYILRLVSAQRNHAIQLPQCLNDNKDDSS